MFFCAEGMDPFRSDALYKGLVVCQKVGGEGVRPLFLLFPSSLLGFRRRRLGRASERAREQKERRQSSLFATRFRARLAVNGALFLLRRLFSCLSFALAKVAFKNEKESSPNTGRKQCRSIPPNVAICIIIVSALPFPFPLQNLPCPASA